MNQQKTRWKNKSKLAFAVAIIPFIGFILFRGFPLVLSFIGIFCNIDLYNFGNIQWNNFAGIKSVFVPGYAQELFYFDMSKYFYKAVIITLLMAVCSVAILGISLFIATLLRENFRGNKLLQVLFFIPNVCSVVSIALMFLWLFDWEGGVLNTILGTNIKWLDDPRFMTWCIVIARLWGGPAYGIVMYKAAFSNINSSLYEAAAVDGANAWQKFRHVTLPSISPTTFFLLQTGLTAGFTLYDLARLIINDAYGIPGGKGASGITLMRLVIYSIMNSSTTDANGVSYMVSCACVISWAMFAVIGTLTVVLFRLREKSAE